MQLEVRQAPMGAPRPLALKSVSVIIPTFNSAAALEQCLESIAGQDYPKELIEIIIADAGSRDATLEIARRFTATIYPNPLKTGEAGKAAGLRHARNEIVALIDSDNILPTTDWLLRMMDPLADEEIVAAEPLEYTWRRADGYITRYSALMGMNDPLCLFLGNYDRYNGITGKWTEIPLDVEDKGDYLKVTLRDARQLPTIGANGFLVRRSELLECSVKDYLFDIDVVYELVRRGQNKVAKVKVGIVHLFCGDVGTFLRKQERRIQDYLYYSKNNLRQYPWRNTGKRRLLKFVSYCLLGVPLLAQSLIGYWRRPDPAWFFHPIACWITLWVYGWGRLGGLVRTRIRSREEWGQ